MKNNFILFILVAALIVGLNLRGLADEGSMIEEQLAEIGTIHEEEVVIVQRKYTRKNWRHEFSPIMFGGVPFGTVRRTLFGGASYSIHVNDWFAFEVFDFLYSKTFFSSFTEDINGYKEGSEPDIKPDFQKLLYFLSTGIQITPFYGKLSSFSRWIAYIEPYFTLGAGVSKTELQSYVCFYPGIGIRAFFREWFSMKLEFRDYLYTERFKTRTDSATYDTALRNNYAVMLSLSFWLPKMPL